MGNEYNYILAMYYNYNVESLGEQTAVVYANKYINWLHLGCKYKDQDRVNQLCPYFARNIKVVPEFFINMIKDIDLKQ